jgi:hypothetical protein
MALDDAFAFIPEGSISYKQRLSLSEFAYATIDSDRQDFAEDENQENLSNFLNRIFIYFFEDAESSILRKVDSVLSELENNGLSFTGTSKDKLRKSYIAHYEKLAEERRKKGNAYAFTISINKEARALIQDDEFTAMLNLDCYQSLNPYFKSLFEEYATLPRAERERIYAKPIVEEFNRAIREKKKIKLITKTRTAKSDGSKSHTLFYLSPYTIASDPENNVNYLDGYGEREVIKEGEEAKDKEAEEPETENNKYAIRLSNIASLRVLSQRAFVSLPHQKDIQQAIEREGGGFVSDEIAQSQITVRVSFTPRGWDDFRHILHRKPRHYVKVGDPLIYDVTCSRFQAETYFFQFGEEVEILAPDYVRARFQKRFELASALYQKKK